MLLTTEQIARARKANPVSFKKLGRKVPIEFPQNPASTDFALRTALLQSQRGLDVDGIFGPNTDKEWEGWVNEKKPDNYIICSGIRVPVDFPVTTWEQDPSWSLYRYNNPESWDSVRNAGFAWREDVTPEVGTLHWDAGFDSRQCHTVLVRKGVSVHFMNDADGHTYQALDAGTVRAWHAGEGGLANKRGWGIEINNPWDLQFQKKSKRPIIKSPGVNGNGPHSHLDFFPEQKKNVVKLCHAMCDYYGIPKIVPTRPAYESFYRGDDNDPPGSIVRGVLKDAEKFKGVWGHFHVSEQKIDCDVELFDHLIASGFK